MAKTVPLDAPTLAWARAAFARYYQATALPAPERIAHREIALFPFAEATLMRRHATVPSAEALSGYLREAVPRHVYYSSAYYRAPAEPTMAAKGWLGADLIFDLDADHLRGAETLDYAGQLRLVKRRLLDLYDDFLIRDFGIDPNATALVFSGGRGYHVHVRDERFRSFTSAERRELVDYVLGTGVEPRAAIEQVREDVRSGRVAGDATVEAGATARRASVRSAARLAEEDAPGWKGRVARGFNLLLHQWQQDGERRAVSDMESWGISPEVARRWAKRLVSKGGLERILTQRWLHEFEASADGRALLDAVVRRGSVEVQGETDAPVTTDIHRLIRLPGSLHGGTGFRVVAVRRDAIPDFDPFRDALLPATEGTVPVTFLTEVRHPFGWGLHRTAGATDELPTPQALFLVLRGEAALRPSPG